LCVGAQLRLADRSSAICLAPGLADWLKRDVVLAI
jgi:hypothetical protein